VNIALFGGTFDPIHSGHLEAARAAARKFRLDRVLFIPTGNPPHKVRDHLTPFLQRYAMVALACANDARFIPSLLETPTPDGRPRYSIETVRKVRRTLRALDRLFFLIGVDAFLEFPQWRQYRRLLDLVNFIVVTRPGFDSDRIRSVLPADLLDSARAARRQDAISLRRGTLYLLRGVNVSIASTEIRKAICAGQQITGLVPRLVEEYLWKEGLYGPRTGGRLQAR
jgi:nicotinate-nucleotide adenylyltransferase